jgi:ATP-dependent RNA helicase MSS116, mitochondrial
MFAACRRGAVSISNITKTASPFFAQAIAPATRSSVLSLSALKFAGPVIVSRYLNTSSAPGYNGQSFASRRPYEDEDVEEHLESGTTKDNDAVYSTFQALADNGLVHPAVIREITHGLGHQTMTPVQSMSINQALKGTDT